MMIAAVIIVFLVSFCDFFWRRNSRVHKISTRRKERNTERKKEVFTLPALPIEKLILAFGSLFCKLSLFDVSLMFGWHYFLTQPSLPQFRPQCTFFPTVVLTAIMRR